VHGAGAALAWWSQRRGADCRPLLAQALSSDVRPALFLNAVGGLGSPDWRGDVESRFEENGGDAAAELAGVLESILFLIERNLALLRARLPVAALWLSGGLAQLDGLCQRLADLTGLPVRRFAEGEASALGAAWLLAGRPREWAPAREWREFAPRPNPALAARQRRWVAMLERSLDRGGG
jgi:glycerol kinase